MRSAWRPAALTTYPALMVPAEVRTAPPTRPQYAAPVTTVTPAARSSETSDATTAAGSTEAVVGENKARSWVRARGSIWRASSAETSSSGTPFARPRRSSSSSPARSAGPRATTSFPQRFTRTPRAMQYSVSCLLPSRVKRAFRLSAA